MIGSNGKLISYYELYGSHDGGFTTREYSEGLARLVSAALRVTGKSRVVLVGHSLGGLIARSALTFWSDEYPALNQVSDVVLVSSPTQGIASFQGRLLIEPGLVVANNATLKKRSRVSRRSR